MEASFQIQSLKSQIENMKLQIDNIQMQSNNMFMMNNNPICEQILNLSIQMFNAGIQAFNTGKNFFMMIIIQKYYKDLRKISDQINLIINTNNMLQMQQPIMLQQPIQQQQLENSKKDYKNIVFENARCPNGKLKTNIVAKFGTTVKEVLDQYMLRVYGTINKNLVFISLATQINRDDEKRVIEDYFKQFNNPVQVLEFNI